MADARVFVMQAAYADVGSAPLPLHLRLVAAASSPLLTYNDEVNLRLLREETETQHKSLEALLPLSEPDLHLSRYQQILQYFHSVVGEWETWASLHAPPRLAALVRERTRSPLLRKDLAFFGLPPLPGAGIGSAASHPVEALLARARTDSQEYEAAFLGAMYVMEGSTLGGQYIARHVEDVLGLAAGAGDAYFRGYGERTAAMWNAFRQLLSAVPDEHASTVITAAQVTFAHLEDTFRRCPATRVLSCSTGS